MATLTQETNSKDTGAASMAKIDQKIEVTIFIDVSYRDLHPGTNPSTVVNNMLNPFN